MQPIRQTSDPSRPLIRSQTIRRGGVENKRRKKKPRTRQCSIFMDRRDQSVVKRKGPRHTQSPSRGEWCVKFVRGYLANGQIKGLVDNLWRFQSFNARHKTLITLEGRTTILLEPARRCRFVGFFSLWWWTWTHHPRTIYTYGKFAPFPSSNLRRNYHGWTIT